MGRLRAHHRRSADLVLPPHPVWNAGKRPRIFTTATPWASQFGTRILGKPMMRPAAQRTAANAHQKHTFLSRLGQASLPSEKIIPHGFDEWLVRPGMTRSCAFAPVWRMPALPGHLAFRCRSRLDGTGTKGGSAHDTPMRVALPRASETACKRKVLSLRQTTSPASELQLKCCLD